MRTRIGVLLLLAALIALAGCAPRILASPRLVAAWPAPGSTIANPPRSMELTFNHTLSAEGTSVAVLSTREDRWLSSSLEVAPDSRNRLVLKFDDTLPAGGYQVQWRAVAARSGGVQDGEYVFHVDGESGLSPRLTLSSSSANPGDVVVVTGRGFSPNRDVRLTIGDDDAVLNSGRADARGRFSIDSRIPESVAFGVQPVWAIDDRQARAAAALRVRWGGWPPLVAWTVGQPGPAHGQAHFEVTVRNRSDYVLEHVRVTIADPPGARLLTAEPAASYADGVLAWDLASVDRGLVGPLRLTYAASRPIATHAVIQFRHRKPHNCIDDECLSAFVSETTSDATLIAPAS